MYNLIDSSGIAAVRCAAVLLREYLPAGTALHRAWNAFSAPAAR